MPNLKPVYDAAKAAREKVDGILAEMLVAFEEGTEEGIQKAMDLRASLDEAKAKADEADQLYVAMRDASADENSPARKFVPVSEAAKKQADGAKTKTRAEFEQLTPQAKYGFMKSGGAVVDEAAE